MNRSEYFYLLRYSVAKKGALKAYLQALSDEILPSEKLSRLSWEKTKRLLHYAYEKVPFYNKRFKSIGLHPSDISSEEQYEQIPVLTRKDIRVNFNLLVSSEADPGKLKISTTGGSTGEPLRIGLMPGRNREIQKWQMMSWWDLNPAVNYASVYRKLPLSLAQKTAAYLITWPQKVIRADASEMTVEGIEKFINSFLRIKPRLLHGYVGAIDTISDYIIDNNIILPAPSVVWLTAAPVSRLQEEKISRAFRAPVCDQYGCSEIYFVSAECPRKEGLHIFSDSVKVEILGEDSNPVPPGMHGKIVLTNLDEYFFPLIRYENGDYGRLNDHLCSCGRSLPLMDKVKGRISDNLILPDKTVLTGEYLTTIFDEYTGRVRQFQIVQNQSQAIEVKVVLNNRDRDQTDAKMLEDIKAVLSQRIKNQVPLTINVADHIDNKKGKLQFIVRE